MVAMMMVYWGSFELQVMTIDGPMGLRGLGLMSRENFDAENAAENFKVSAAWYSNKNLC